MIFFRAFQHLLPKARAWRTTIDKQLRQFFEGLSGSASDARQFIDDVWSDIFPDTTRELTKWEDQFGLPTVGLTEQERRDRLNAAWKAVGGQDPAYIQETLQARGFDVYVHEWWDPADEKPVGVAGCVSPRGPFTYIGPEYSSPNQFMMAGDPFALAGNPLALAGNAVLGYPLVNKILETVRDLEPLCGEADVECGEEVAACGVYTGFIDQVRPYIVPTDPAKWPYFLYIGGQTFGETATLNASRRDEFEALCLEICPTQLWLGILVEYE